MRDTYEYSEKNINDTIQYVKLLGKQILEQMNNDHCVVSHRAESQEAIQRFKSSVTDMESLETFLKTCNVDFRVTPNSNFMKAEITVVTCRDELFYINLAN